MPEEDTYDKAHIKRVLMERDEMHAEDADRVIEQAQDQFDEYVEEGDLGRARDICEEFFGLEPDFMMAFM